MNRLATLIAAAAALFALAAAAPARADAVVTADTISGPDKKVEMIFQAWGCFGVYKGLTRVCNHQTLSRVKGSWIRYHWPAGTSGRTLQLGTVCQNGFWGASVKSDNSSHHKVGWTSIDGSYPQGCSANTHDP